MVHRCEALLKQRKVQFVMCHAHAQAPGRLQAEACPLCRRTGVLILRFGFFGIEPRWGVRQKHFGMCSVRRGRQHPEF